MGRGDAPSRGTPGLDGLELLPVGNTAADVVEQFPQGDSHGDFHQTGVDDLTGKGEDLCPFTLLGSDGGIPIGTVENNMPDGGQGLDVVDHRRVAPETLLGGERRFGPGLTALAFDGGHQSGLFTADEGAGTHTNLYVEAETTFKDVLSEKAHGSRLLQGGFEPFDRQGVLGTAIDKPFVGADGVGGYGHTFDHRVGVSFENGPIHEGSRIALVGVTDDILLFPFAGLTELPLQARRETSSTTASLAGFEHFLDHRFRRHLGDNLSQGLVAPVGDVLIDALGVDLPAESENNLLLLLEEGDLPLLLDDLAGFRSGPELLLVGSPLQEVLFHDRFDIVLGKLDIERTIGIDDHDGSHFAGAHASGLDEVDFVG